MIKLVYYRRSFLLTRQSWKLFWLHIRFCGKSVTLKKHGGWDYRGWSLVICQLDALCFYISLSLLLFLPYFLTKKLVLQIVHIRLWIVVIQHISSRAFVLLSFLFFLFYFTRITVGRISYEIADVYIHTTINRLNVMICCSSLTWRFVWWEIVSRIAHDIIVSWLTLHFWRAVSWSIFSQFTLTMGWTSYGHEIGKVALLIVVRSITQSWRL